VEKAPLPRHAACNPDASVSRLLPALLLFASTASAQTVADIAARGACSTAGVEEISRQLAEAQMCLRPGDFVRFTPHPNITLSSSRVHPYLQASARDALHRAADSTTIRINSAFRTVADQYVLYHSGGCGLAATPGRSNHQSGRAVDVADNARVRPTLEAASCAWLGSRDPVHFDCPGEDRRNDSVLAFQRLWNRNNEGDTIAEDGLYGPQTEARLARTPAGGFATTGCSCDAGCDGDTMVSESCERTACEGGLVCTTEGGLRCADASCPATGTTRTCDGAGVRVCEDGTARTESCAAGETCTDGGCVPEGSSDPCAELADGTYCADASSLLQCAGGETSALRSCDFGCLEGACAPPPTSPVDGGTAPDAGVVFGDGGVREDPPADPGEPASSRALAGGCSASGSGTSLAWLPFALLVLRLRR